MIRIIILSVSILLTSLIGSAQNIQDKNALKIINQLEQKYNTYQSIEANFNLTTEIPEEEPIKESGKFIQDGTAYHLDSDQQTIFSDGKSIWLFLKNQNEVQINSIAEDEGSLINLTPRGIINLFNNSEFDYAIVNEEKGISHIEFKPLDKNSEYSKARLAIDINKKELKSAKVFYKDGIRLTLDVVDITPNQSYDAEIFVFNAAEYPGVHVEDLRID